MGVLVGLAVDSDGMAGRLGGEWGVFVECFLGRGIGGGGGEEKKKSTAGNSISGQVNPILRLILGGGSGGEVAYDLGSHCRV